MINVMCAYAVARFGFSGSASAVQRCCTLAGVGFSVPTGERDRDRGARMRAKDVPQRQTILAGS